MLTGGQKIITFKELHQFILNDSLKHFANHRGETHWSIIIAKIYITFLWIAVTVASLQSAGKTPSLIELNAEAAPRSPLTPKELWDGNYLYR